MDDYETVTIDLNDGKIGSNCEFWTWTMLTVMAMMIGTWAITTT